MSTILGAYEQQIAKGELEGDSAQADVARRLAVLQDVLDAYPPRRNGLARFFDRDTEPPKGVYLWGGVGRGKTMLMDLFFEETAFEPKTRRHFHEFMADVHDRIGVARTKISGDPIPHVARQIAAEARLLCFDEMHITDIADAMILSRLFAALFEAGTVVVTTSNVHPTGLYKNGLNRELFLPFVAMLLARMDVIEVKSEKDFRLDKLSGAQLYFYPADAAAKTALDEHWDRLTSRRPGKSVALDVKGRKLAVPLSSAGVARFPFAALCDQPLAANDYLSIAHAFHTVIVDDIPVLTPERRDVARRFINMVDAFYDNRICLIASAAAKPEELYARGDGADLFERTASRLTEMRSEAYLKGHSGGRARR